MHPVAILTKEIPMLVRGAAVQKPSHKYVDCNESSWQVGLWIHGELFYFSARVASTYTDKETDEQRELRQKP